MFRYLELSTLCDIAFTWFLLSWFFTRHVGFIIITISAIWDAPKFMTFAWEPEKEYYYSYQMHMTCVGLLIILQVSVTNNSEIVLLNLDEGYSATLVQ